MIPIDFDWKFYTSYYIDLNQFNEKKARCHYLNHGIHEGRLYKPVINNSSKIHTSFIERHKIYIPYFFDWKFYKSLYSDCSSLDEKGVKFHYIKIGIEENRKYNNNILLPKNFDFLFYKHYYKDLGKMGYHSLVRHYLLHGIFERRICNRHILSSINKMILANKYKWITNNKLLLTHDSCIIPKEWNYLNIDDIRSTINNLLKDHINAANIIRDWYINIIVRSNITMAMGERDKRETVEEETRVRELFDLPYDVYCKWKNTLPEDSIIKLFPLLNNTISCKDTVVSINKCYPSIKKKLKYKLNLFDNQSLDIYTIDLNYHIKIKENNFIINDNKTIIIDTNKYVLFIYELKDKRLELFINNQFITIIKKINNINLLYGNYYKCSINIPISLSRTNIDTLVNFDHIIHKYKHYSYQLNILHTDYEIDLLDYFIIKYDNINYIYVENPNYFNLGYTRNLYKYLNLSNNVMFVDVDIPLKEQQINIMIEQLKTYDIVKPYDKQLIHLTKEEKYKYLINGDIIINRHPRCLFTNTGGITIFKKNVLEECGGYEELNCYGSEDRFLDVITIHKGYKLKKNEFGLIHLWHPKLFNSGKENKNWLKQSKKSKEFNLKYYNCILNLKNRSLSEWTRNHDDIHCECNHKTEYIDKLIKQKQKYNFNLNLFENNKYLDYITLKPEQYIYMDIQDKILFIMGNGPSLKEVMDNPDDLKILRNNHTFGLNAAYRAYEKYDFYPTYFGCFDYVVNESHKESFENLVLENNLIKEFYFIGNGKDKQNLYKEEVRNSERFKKFNFINVAIDKYPGICESFDKYYNPGSSGANALQIGIMKGYKKIVLLGCDCNYVEEVDGVIHYDEKAKSRLELTKDLDNNPNYWFSDYQKKGDRFNLPGTSKFQMGSWANMSKFCPKDVEIINASMISKIPYFPKKDFNKIKSFNIILVCSDYKYYNALLILLNSIIDYDLSHDLIMIFDLGLTNEQIEFINKINLNLKIINILPSLKEHDTQLNLNNVFVDIKNYGFKPYVLRHFDKFLDKTLLVDAREKNRDINVLFIDSGFCLNNSLKIIFDKINNKEFFCTDHNDCPKIITFKNKTIINERLGSLCNILPPSVYTILKESKITLSKEHLKEQYIKAGLVGYKYYGKYQFIINKNLEYFYKSKIYELTEEITNLKEKTYYKNLFNDNDILLSFTGCHRYDQSILSVLVILYKLKEDATKYSYVIGQKQGIISLLIYNFKNIISNYEIQEKFNSLSKNKEIEYSLNQLGNGVQIANYFGLKSPESEADIKRKILSDNDIIWHHVKILNEKNLVSEIQLENLYYYLFNKFIEKSRNSKTFFTKDKCNLYFEIEDIIKPVLKTFILHRGLMKFKYSIFNKIKNNNKKLFILGNGPSLKKIMDDPLKLEILKNNHTFGLNAAYRVYDKYNFYPTYFGCFDYIVNDSHKNNFEKLVLTNNPIKQFFFIGNGKNKQDLYSKEVRDSTKFTNLNFITRTPEEKLRNDILAYDFNNFIDMLTSGTNSVQVGILKGYSEIILLGCDCNYTEVINGAEIIDNKGKIVMKENINKNPNYWFDEYQQKGDEFNVPNTNGCQLPAWNRLYETIKCLKLNVKILNVNDNSKIECFDKILIDEYFNNYNK